METAYKEGLKRDEELKKIKENLVGCLVCAQISLILLMISSPDC